MRKNDFSHINFLSPPALAWGVMGLLIGWLAFSTHKPIIKYRTSSSEALTQCGTGSEAYTCSMHPDVKKSAASDCPICGMKLIPLTAHMSKRSAHIYPASHDYLPTAKVVYGPMKKEIQVYGFIRVDQNQSMLITAEYPGRISAIRPLQQGSHIHAHKQLGSIYSEELIAAQKEFFDATCFRVTDPNMFIAARKKLRRWSFSEEHLLSLEEGGEPISSFPISSHFSGMVQQVLVKPGTYVQVGTPIARLIQPNAYWAEVEVLAEDLAWLKVGDRVKVHNLSENTPAVVAPIIYIDDWIDEQRGTAKVRVLLPATGENWKVGKFVQGSLAAELPKWSLQIPQTAVLWTGERAVVYLKQDSGSQSGFYLQEILLGEKIGASYEVLAGLKEGQEVASKGAFSLDAQAQLSGNIHLLSDDITPGSQMNMNVPDSHSTSPTHKTEKNISHTGHHIHNPQ